MTEESFYIFQVIGIFLTFCGSILAIYVSYKALNISKQTTFHTNRASTITLGRERWASLIQKSGAEYLALLNTLLLYDNLSEEVYRQFFEYHYGLKLLVFYTDKELFANLDSVYQIITTAAQEHHLETSEKSRILETHIPAVQERFRFLIQDSWKKERSEISPL